MSKYMYNKVMEKVPQFVATMVANEQGEELEYRETLIEFTPYGNKAREDVFEICKYELLRHIKNAKRVGCTITINDPVITVVRNMGDGSKFVETYEPIPY